MKILPFAVSALVTAFSSQAMVRHYEADLNDSSWQLAENSRLKCTLSHQIPNYGEAVFSSVANRQMNMQFELDMLRLPDTYGVAEVRSLPPRWKPGHRGRVIAQMDLHKQFSPSLEKKVAWTMLSELEQGMNPKVFYQDWYNDNNKVAVGLSPARFSKAYQDFVGCLGNLLNYSFEDIAYTVLNYELNTDELTKPSKKRIAMITEYLALDPELELVLIDAFTDSYGGRWPNLKLAERRAAKIQQYFVEAGIDVDRITATGYGEKRHIASNQSVIGREQNRRVVIRMDKP
ncbi:OmpA family protein [Thalassotalea sp. LPB0316]|nr:OmpA family protein [Thalassotalea sp. LPB0316]